jgi:dephospho-CoA kinase
MSAIGLTGNFGMGKSTVLALFSKLGALTFNVDDFVHNILEYPEVINKIAGVLGDDIMIQTSGNISINKKSVAEIIFREPQKRKAVEMIIHPEVLKAITQTVSEISAQMPSSAIIFEVPLLFEAGYDKHFSKSVVVYCSRDTAVSRLIKKGFSKDEADRRLEAQMNISEKIKLADYVINNSDAIEKTAVQVKKIYSELIKD